MGFECYQERPRCWNIQKPLITIKRIANYKKKTEKTYSFHMYVEFSAPKLLMAGK